LARDAAGTVEGDECAIAPAARPPGAILELKLPEARAKRLDANVQSVLNATLAIEVFLDGFIQGAVASFKVTEQRIGHQVGELNQARRTRIQEHRYFAIVASAPPSVAVVLEVSG